MLQRSCYCISRIRRAQNPRVGQECEDSRTSLKIRFATFRRMPTGDTPYAVKRAATGLGLFATKPIPRGTKIVEYVGPRISNADVEKSNGKYFFGLNKQWSIDGSGRENIARYANHSCAPNAEAIITRGHIWICSKRNIKAGEEITYDYGKEYFEGIIQDIGCKRSEG